MKATKLQVARFRAAARRVSLVGGIGKVHQAPPVSYAKRPDIGALLVAGSIPPGLLCPASELAALAENARSKRFRSIDAQGEATDPVFIGDQPRAEDCRGVCHRCGALLVSARWYVNGRGFVIEWNCWAALTTATCDYREVK